MRRKDRRSEPEKKERKACQSFLPLVHVNALLFWPLLGKMCHRENMEMAENPWNISFLTCHRACCLLVSRLEKNNGFMCRSMDISRSHSVLTQMHSILRSSPDPCLIINFPSACPAFSWSAAHDAALIRMCVISPWTHSSAAWLPARWRSVVHRFQKQAQYGPILVIPKIELLALVLGLRQPLRSGDESMSLGPGLQHSLYPSASHLHNRSFAKHFALGGGT